MIWFMVKVIAALFVIAIFVSFIADAAHSISSDAESLKQAFERNSKDESNTPVPSIQYKRYTEEEAEYLQGIWQGQPLTEKNRFRIIYDFLYSGNKYFLLGRDYGNLYLRRYTAEEEAGEDTICILEDVKEGIASELKKEDSWILG